MTTRRKRNYFDNVFSGDDITPDETDCLERMTGCERDREDEAEKELNDILAGGRNNGCFTD